VQLTTEGAKIARLQSLCLLNCGHTSTSHLVRSQNIAGVLMYTYVPRDSHTVTPHGLIIIIAPKHMYKPTPSHPLISSHRILKRIRPILLKTRMSRMLRLSNIRPFQMLLLQLPASHSLMPNSTNRTLRTPLHRRPDHRPALGDRQVAVRSEFLAAFEAAHIVFLVFLYAVESEAAEEHEGGEEEAGDG